MCYEKVGFMGALMFSSFSLTITSSRLMRSHRPRDVYSAIFTEAIDICSNLIYLPSQRDEIVIVSKME